MSETNHGSLGKRTMNQHAIFCILASLSIPMLASCQESPEPKSILNKAIAAHGGLEKITKPRRGLLKGSMGKINEAEMSFEEKFDLPKRWKRMTTIIHNGKRIVSGQLRDEGKLWEWDEGEPVRERKDDGKTKPHFELIAILAELLDERMKFAPLKGIKVNDRRAIGFRATWAEGGGDYYFDKENGLLVQTNMKLTPQPRVDVDLKAVFGNYKEIDGVQLPHRMTSSFKGAQDKEYQVLTDIVLTEISILDTLPDDAFSFPNKE